MKNPKPFKVPTIISGKRYAVYVVETTKEALGQPGGSEPVRLPQFYWSEDSATLAARSVGAQGTNGKVKTIVVISDKTKALYEILSNEVKVEAPTEEETTKLTLAKKLREAGLSAEEMDLLKVPTEFRP